jgi:hypothetical protein
MNSPQFPPCKICGERHHAWELCPEFVRESTNSTTMLGLCIITAVIVLVAAYFILFKF